MGPSVNWKSPAIFSTWALLSRITCRLFLLLIFLDCAEVRPEFVRDFEHPNPKSFLASVTPLLGAVVKTVNKRLYRVTLNIRFFMLMLFIILDICDN